MIDVGTSGVRAAIVQPDATVTHEHYVEVLPTSPEPGFVEFDAAAMAGAALDVATAALASGGPVAAVGIANQRASTVVWDRATGEPVGPGIGWQDLRTVGTCLVLQADGIRLAPNLSATKLAFLLDTYDPDRSRDLCFGTVDSWIAWTLSEGAAHITDATNAALTGLRTADQTAWHDGVLDALRIPQSCLPRVVDSTGECAEASALDGAPPIAGIAGDQQASLVGQGCLRPGLAKVTFGTGGMLDVCLAERPTFEARGPGGTFPIVAWQRDGERTWGLEAVMLSAGSNVEWLRDDLGLIASSAESHDVASQCSSTDGVVYVPALLGLGTPQWDYGARGTLLGITRGTDRPQVVRAVLEGIAHRGMDLVEAAERDGALDIPALRVDGGMSANPTFIQALADASQKPVEVSPVLEATTLGAAFLAGLAAGTWSSFSEIADIWAPRMTVEPGPSLDRDRWAEAVAGPERGSPSCPASTSDVVRARTSHPRRRSIPYIARMTYKRSVLAVVAVFTLLLAGCGSSSKKSTTTTASGSQSTSAPATGGGSSGNAVEIKGFAFSPAALKVSAGTKVTWTNKDSTDHTATSLKGAPASFDSGHLGNGKTFSFTFTKKGHTSTTAISTPS